MNTLTLSLLAYVSLFQNSGSYRIANNHRVVSKRYDYSFEYPKNLHISATNGTPYFFNFSPKHLVSHGVRVGVPKGGAEIGVVADAESHQAGSIEKWIELDRIAEVFTSTHEVRLLPATTIKRAVEIASLHDDGDSRHKQITRTVTIYFDFQGHPLAAYLSYNAKDPKASLYEDTLMAGVQSFRPLDRIASPN